ncbi:endogenous retrovirus group K member 113 Env polyprotein-like isoform X1 [Marmota flaviventris]|uniref:endogenous retrovirus group K member 113 Env polyprotein-like isoform X1 n=1 Tax=Marmota flaviventris TaxID=93162 RepID=UPI003A849C3F
MEEIEPRFKRLRIDQEEALSRRRRYRKRMKKDQIDPAKKLISWEDLKKLITQASRILRHLGENRTPVMMVATVIALLGCQVKGDQVDTYWTYFPDPPLVHPAVWTGESIPVFTNDSFMMGGFTDTHITPNHVTRFNYSGYSAQLPLCWSHDKHAGCLKVSFEEKTAIGRHRLTNNSFYGDLRPYTRSVIKMGLSHNKPVISAKPPRMPHCPNSSTIEIGTFPRWMDCVNTFPVQHKVSKDSGYILDWSPKIDKRQLRRNSAMTPAGFVSNILTYSKGGVQKDVWRLIAASEFLHFTDKPLPKFVGKNCKEGSCYGLRACVQSPYVLIIGNVKVKWIDDRYIVTCNKCNLTNCITRYNGGKGVLILHQPSFVLLPANISEPWYADTGLQVLQQIHAQLTRPKRAIGVIIVGVLALVSFIASTVSASLTLSQNIQHAKFLNNLAQNTSKALRNQVNIDERIETKLNALEATVIDIGNELSALKFKERLKCHANYKYVCVTAAKYNASLWDWEKVKNHLLGIWQNSNNSLDILELHHHIQDIQNNRADFSDPSSLANQILKELNGFNPGNILKHSAWYIIGLFSLLLILFCVIIIGWRVFGTRIQKLQRVNRRLIFKNRKGEYVGSHPDT